MHFSRVVAVALTLLSATALAAPHAIEGREAGGFYYPGKGITKDIKDYWDKWKNPSSNRKNPSCGRKASDCFGWEGKRDIDNKPRAVERREAHGHGSPFSRTGSEDSVSPSSSRKGSYDDYDEEELGSSRKGSYDSDYNEDGWDFEKRSLLENDTSLASFNRPNSPNFPRGKRSPRPQKKDSEDSISPGSSRGSSRQGSMDSFSSGPSSRQGSRKESYDSEYNENGWDFEKRSLWKNKAVTSSPGTFTDPVLPRAPPASRTASSATDASAGSSLSQPSWDDYDHFEFHDDEKRSLGDHDLISVSDSPVNPPAKAPSKTARIVERRAPLNATACKALREAQKANNKTDYCTEEWHYLWCNDPCI